jgi:hypothetical protein
MHHLCELWLFPEPINALTTGIASSTLWRGWDLYGDPTWQHDTAMAQI